MSLIKIKDALGLSPVGVKIIEKVSDAIGTLYRPRAIRKEAEAQAYEIEVLAKARGKEKLLQADTVLDIEERARKRIDRRELIRQFNIENITEAALEFAGEEDHSGTEPTAPQCDVDDDWLARFMDKAQDVSSETMQQVWGRVLAKEIRKPGTFSLRSLEVLSNMICEDATVFQRFCHLCFDPGYAIKMRNETHLGQFGVSYDDMMRLRAADVLHGSDMLSRQFEVPRNVTLEAMFNGIKVLITHPEQTKFVFPNLPLTPTGQELMALIDKKPNFDYLNAVKEDLEKQKFHMHINVG